MLLRGCRWQDRCDGERPSGLGRLKPRERGRFNGTAYGLGCLLRSAPKFQYKMQGNQVDRNGLSTPPRSRTRMLDGIGVDGKSVNLHVLRIRIFASQHVSVCGPAAR